MNFTLHQLKIFATVAKCKSITRAAEELFLTQPAISLQLKKLQGQFDIPLTEVVGRQLFITDFGLQIAERCERILEETDSIQSTVDQYKGLLSGHIKISVVSTGKYVIPYFVKPFTDKYPRVRITIDVSNKGKVIKDLVNNESDFSLVSVVPENLTVHSLELMENKLYLVGSNVHSKPIKSVGELEDVSLLFREEGSATRNAMEQFLKENNVEAKKTLSLVSNEAVKQAINAGLGYSIVPLIGLRLYLKSEELKIHHLPELPIVTKWNLIYNTGKRLSPAHEAFLDFVNEHKNEIIRENFDWTMDGG
ncbi:MAG: LysR family transcriptional regulator [Bacteroidia bacterium]|nr:LysR family transcriptional regulator [Bacteroidia bacterium]